jgi:hypothetical protein
MKLVIQGDRISAMVGDDYQTADLLVDAPNGFDLAQAHRYRYDAGSGDIVLRVATDYGRIVTRLAFLNRFTDAEAIGIDLASIGATTQAAALRRHLNKINAAEEIQLDNAETRAGVQALETAGLIAAGRATAILDAQVQAHEVPARYRALYYLPEVPVV